MIAWLNKNPAIAIDTLLSYKLENSASASYWINFKSSHKAAKLCSWLVYLPYGGRFLVHRNGNVQTDLYLPPTQPNPRLLVNQPSHGEKMLEQVTSHMFHVNSCLTEAPV